MSTGRLSFIRVILLLAILYRSGITSAQWYENTNIPEIDTTDYIPSFYRGALDYNLMIAASKGYASEIERLIKKGADVNTMTDEGATPLIFAIANNNIAAISVLLYFKPDVNTITSSSETPLLLAVKNRRFEIAEALIRAGADIDFADKYGASPLHYSSIYGYLDIVDLLLYYEASIDLKSEEGSTPLLASVWAGYADVADLLIQNGANMEARDNEGFTPFLMASFYGDTLLMNLLYKKGVDVYAINNARHNALTLSIIANHIEAAKLLLQMGNKWTENPDALNPYSVATKYSRKEFPGLLEKNNIPGQVKYGIDQVTLSLSSRFSFHDLYNGVNVSFKEPLLNGGITFGCDTKLWYSRIQLKNSENLFYQYMYKGTVAYAGLFKDFILAERPVRYNISFSASLYAGYSFGISQKGTEMVPANKLMAIPAISFKFTKMHLTATAGVEYLKTDYYKNGPVWFRLGFSYNYFFDNVRSQFKTIRWY